MNSAVSAKPAAFLEPADVKRILYLAVPAQLALLTQTGVNLVDTYLIGLLEEPDRSAGQAMLSFSLALLWAVGGFLVGLSIDGPKDLHDRFRITRRGATASPATATARRTASSRPPAASSPQLSLPRHQSVCRIETSKQGVRS